MIFNRMNLNLEPPLETFVILVYIEILRSYRKIFTSTSMTSEGFSTNYPNNTMQFNMEPRNFIVITFLFFRSPSSVVHESYEF